MEYAVYKGDELLGIGTAKELAERLKVKVETIKFYSTASYQKRIKKENHNRLISIKLEDD
ncbi:hypothetical protein CKN63_12470 [Carnobacterium divergens]|uniref:hypothetical protein n=1 Tax=Carnobacterium divergens TaxID=2748 RepID=UPI001072AB1D|nr:hypothetical protein [Carnobacterium divergens]TFI61436.1 hypothetical protein CKN59_12895 [Carnobacterium divergens]TFI61714.1 hypothetical protein CKN76_12510 [Carnobacterium divergens]TFI77013.1 hypothetical protein CKN74_13125 [Carnobacterium divergens]TFJ00128.1 hypothetical protein CKN75_13555 [Carnobacterium divergens]TFJ08616.1 hypothetical protein CKN71_13330 [Carnobacterium divergens]